MSHLLVSHYYGTGDRQYKICNCVTWRRKAAEKEAALTAGREHLSSWHCVYIPSQDASLARERSGLTERPTGKCWRLAPVETQDYMRPYSTFCARAPGYVSPLSFSSTCKIIFPLWLLWTDSAQEGKALHKTAYAILYYKF